LKSRDVVDVAKDAARAIAAMFIGNASSIVTFSVASVIIARLLGPSDYGLYTMALAVPSVMMACTDFVTPALVRAMTRSMSKGRGESVQGFVKAGISFELGVAASAFLILVSLADTIATHVMNRPNMAHSIQIASIAVIGGVLLATSNSIFVGLDMTGWTALLSFLSSVIKLVMAPSLIMLGFGVSGALAGHVLAYLSAGILGSLIALKLSKNEEPASYSDSSATTRLVPMVRFGMPIYTSNLIDGFLSQYHLIILPWFASNTDIGNYSVTMIFSLVIALLTNPIYTALFAAFSKLDADGNPDDVRTLFRHSLRYTNLLLVPASFFIAIASESIIEVFYGAHYAQASQYLKIYSMNFMFVGISSVLRGFFNGIGRTRRSLEASVVQLSSILCFSVIFTRFYGVIGFICATLLSNILLPVYLGLAARYQHGLQFDPKGASRILVSSLLSTTATLGLTLLPYPYLTKLAVTIAIFGTIYLTITPIVGGIENEDLANLKWISNAMGPISKLSKIALCYQERILSTMRDR